MVVWGCWIGIGASSDAATGSGRPLPFFLSWDFPRFNYISYAGWAGRLEVIAWAAGHWTKLGVEDGSHIA